MTLEEMNILANRETRARRRMEAMGFRLVTVEVVPSFPTDGVVMRGLFKCVCGRTEFFADELDADELPVSVALEAFDPALFLQRYGSFSRRHLLSDGYTEAQVADIIARGERFDEMEAKA
jgi:hypothetical protein